MNQPHRILTNTLALAVAKLVERASTTFLGFFVARSLGPAALGVYTTTMVYYAVVFHAAAMGSTNYLVREVAKHRDQTSRYLVHLSAMVLATAPLVIGGSVLVIPHLGYSREMTSSLYLVVIAILPGALASFQEAVFIAHQRVEFITYTSVIGAFVNVGISLWLLRRGFGMVSLVAAFVVVQYLIMLCYFVFIRRYIARLQLEFNFRFARQLLKEIQAFAGSSLLSGIFARPEVVILSFFHNEAQVGYYSAALKLVDIWALIPQIYMTNIFPVMSRAYHSHDQRFALIRDKSVKYLLIISLPLAAGTIAAAGPIVRTMYGRGFEPTVIFLDVLALIMPMTSFFSVTWRVLAARGEQGLVTGIEVITTVVRLVTGYALIAWLGALGAALTVTSNLFLQNVLLAFYVRRNGTRIPVLRLILRPGAAALCMAGATYLLRGHFALWQLVPAAMLIYAVMLVLLQAFSSDDLELFRRVIGRKVTSGAVAQAQTTLT